MVSAAILALGTGLVIAASVAVVRVKDDPTSRWLLVLVAVLLAAATAGAWAAQPAGLPVETTCTVVATELRAKRIAVETAQCGQLWARGPKIPTVGQTYQVWITTYNGGYQEADWNL